jgi:phage tail tape-measure protein
MTKIKDPLGLKELDAVVTELRSEASGPEAPTNETWRSLVSRLDTAYDAFEVKMDLLRDRYGVLKQTSAQLADEVAWLRDQLDDLSCEDESATKPGAAPKAPSEAATGQAQRVERRYVDRWNGRRP